MSLTTVKAFPSKIFSHGSFSPLLIRCSDWKLDSLCWLCTLGCTHMKSPVGNLIAKCNIELLYISEVLLRDGRTKRFQDAFTSSLFQVWPCQSIV